MEKSIMASGSLIELEFITEPHEETHFHENIELLYLLTGNLQVTVEDEIFQMKPGDILVVNANKKHSYSGDEDAFTGRFVISYSRTSELLEQSMILFWCNSVIDKNEAYDTLRKLITQIFSQYQENDARGHIFLNSLYYQMLHTLTSNFLLTDNDIRYEAEKSRSDDRMQEILQYLRANYRQNISLQDLADKMYLSPAYLSKYIKKQCNVSYIDLINSVRLDRSMEELLYTDASIMKVAMDNGFASVAAYNKVFREKYQKTPSEFRKEYRQKRNEMEKSDGEKSSLIRQKVEAYLIQNPAETEMKGSRNYLLAEIDGGVVPEQEWKFCGNRMINLGTALNLTQSAFRQQVLLFKEKFGIEYVRFWDIYAPEMYLDIHAPKDRLHFGRLDEVVDFLVQNGLKPYIELGFKSFRLLKTTQNALMEIPRDLEFASDEEMREFFAAFLQHFVKRYGTAEVSGWYFEYWKKEALIFQNLSYSYTPMSKEAQADYYRKFDILAKAFREVLPQVHIGGGGFSLQHYGREGLRDILTEWKCHSQLPDFISLNCYPYQIQKDGAVYFEKRSTDMEFVKHNLELAKEMMEQVAFPRTELHVSEYSFTLSNRNIINDSCVKAAFLMRNAISCADEADMMGYWVASDGYSDLQDAQAVLFGGCGLLTKTNIPKPAFYALEFMNRVHGKLFQKDTNYVITGSGRGSFRIVCHNLKNLNYNYYLTDENKIKIQNIPLMLEDKDELSFRIKIRNVKNGTYIVKSNYVNREYGSVQDEWLRLEMESDLNLQEQDYLRKISTPRLSLHRVKAEAGLLEIEVTLKPNEIRYLHVIFAD